jgi:predicted O-methyltransferase YrrM
MRLMSPSVDADSGTSVVSLVSDIERLVAGVHGWSPTDELFSLAMLVYATSHLEGDVVEVGSWCGRSAVVLGSVVRDTHGAVHCVDLFPTQDDWQQNADGSYSFAVQIQGRTYRGYSEQTVWPEPFERQLSPVYQQSRDIMTAFRSNVRARGLQDVIRVHRGTSATFVAEVGEGLRCRLAFIDGDHGHRAVVEDIRNLQRLLVPGGWMVFDDAFSGYDGVDTAIRELILANSEFDVTRQLTRKCFAARRAVEPA